MCVFVCACLHACVRVVYRADLYTIFEPKADIGDQVLGPRLGLKKGLFRVMPRKKLGRVGTFFDFFKACHSFVLSHQDYFSNF